MRMIAEAILVSMGLLTGAYIVRTIVKGIVRILESRRRPQGSAIELQDRLARIEVALDTIALEVERLREHHSFNVQLALNRPNAEPSRVVTPL